MAAAIISSPSPVQSTQARVNFDVGAVVAGRYRISSLLGEGSTGAVYAAEHVSLHKKVAIKILHPELTNVPDGVARFEREAMATARIEHQNVASAVDFGRLDEGLLYLALEFVDGVSLRAQVAQGPFTVERTLHIAQQIASALAAAQALDIVHRDLKPENVMLATKGGDCDFVKVLDFGVARVPVEASNMGGPAALTKAGAVFGTAEYMPPEQGIGQKVDTRADLYALGVMMFEMLTGVRPYVETNPAQILAQQLTQPIPTIAERAPGVQVPPELERLVHRLLAKHPQHRIQRADEVCKVIEALISGNIGELHPSVRPEAALEPLPAFALNTQLPGTCSPLVAADVVAAHAAQSDGASSIPSVARASNVPASDRIESARPQFPRRLATAPVVVPLVRKLFTRIDALVERGRDALPARLRNKLAPVPTPWLSFIATALLCCLILGAAISIRQVRSARAAREAEAARIAASAAASVSAVQPNAVTAPSAPPLAAVDGDSKDPEALLAQAQAKQREGHDTEAVNIVGRVLGKHPDKRNDSRVSAILFKAASSTAKGASNSAFSLLQGVMAAAGAEVNYQLAIDKSLPAWVRARAEKWLHSPQFDRASSDALRMAVRLRQAPTCDTKHGMLAAAGKVGGAAALAYMRELQLQAGCGLSGKDDCYPCLRGDNQLGDAMAQIETRLRQ